MRSQPLALTSHMQASSLVCCLGSGHTHTYKHWHSHNTQSKTHTNTRSDPHTHERKNFCNLSHKTYVQSEKEKQGDDIESLLFVKRQQHIETLVQGWWWWSCWPFASWARFAGGGQRSVIAVPCPTWSSIHSGRHQRLPCASSSHSYSLSFSFRSCWRHWRAERKIRAEALKLG